MYECVDERGLHEALLSSCHFSECVESLVRGCRLERLLLRTLQLGRVKEAIQLVAMYNREHGSSTSGRGSPVDSDPASNTDPGLDALKVHMICLQTTPTNN